MLYQLVDWFLYDRDLRNERTKSYLLHSLEHNKMLNGFLNTMKTHIRLYHNGRHTWDTPAILNIGCAIKVEEFPFDMQTCEARFGSFTSDTQDQLDLIPENDTADLTKYSSVLSQRLLNNVPK